MRRHAAEKFISGVAWDDWLTDCDTEGLNQAGGVPFATCSASCFGLGPRAQCVALRGLFDRAFIGLEEGKTGTWEGVINKYLNKKWDLQCGTL